MGVYYIKFVLYYNGIWRLGGGGFITQTPCVPRYGCKQSTESPSDLSSPLYLDHVLVGQPGHLLVRPGPVLDERGEEHRVRGHVREVLRHHHDAVEVPADADAGGAADRADVVQVGWKRRTTEFAKKRLVGAGRVIKVQFQNLKTHIPP